MVFYRSGGGKIIPWCPEVVLYLIQPEQVEYKTLGFDHISQLKTSTIQLHDLMGRSSFKCMRKIAAHKTLTTENYQGSEKHLSI